MILKYSIFNHLCDFQYNCYREIFGKEMFMRHVILFHLHTKHENAAPTFVPYWCFGFHF